jgi:hypothetical protein
VGWTIHNDRDSVTVGINVRIRLCRQQGLVPSLIRLGRYHTRLFLKEASMDFIPNRKPSRIIHSGLVWDERHNRLAYSRAKIPFRFNDTSIHGIVVEGRPRQRRSKMD